MPQPKKKKNPESDLTRKIVTAIQSSYPKAWVVKFPGFRGKLPSGNYAGTKPGVPDLLVLIDSNFFGLEIKVGKNRPSQNQQNQLDAIAEAGGHPAVVRSVKETLETIEGKLK